MEQAGRDAREAQAADLPENDSIPVDPFSYIEQGWSILPCHSIRNRQCTCGNRECHAPGKHPRTRNGVKDASAEGGVIEMWLKDWPDCNWAVACGAVSGIFVVDVDFRNGGSWREDLWGPEPDTLTAATGGGGRHYIFAYPSNGEPLGNKRGLVPGVDIKSDNGYAVLPPSRHISGGVYAWLREGRTT